MARELNAQAHRVEKWGLPIPRDENGNPLKRGRASIKILGERIKPILGKRAESERRAHPEPHQHHGLAASTAGA